jgi:hypothetical protein
MSSSAGPGLEPEVTLTVVNSASMKGVTAVVP